MAKQPELSEVSACAHCGNFAPMKLVATHSQVQRYEEKNGPGWEQGRIFELLECPACHGLSLRRCNWHEGMDPEEVTYQVLYPSTGRMPVGLPDEIRRAYESALKVRSIDANAYGVLVGRVLEMVAASRGAKGNSLDNKLADLASRGEIPDKLVDVAKNIRQLRNVGAHATIGDLTPAETSVLDDLCRGFLEYLYSAPYWVAQAEQRLASIKKTKSK